MSYIFYGKKDIESLDFRRMRVEYVKNVLMSLVDGTMHGDDATKGWDLIDSLEGYVISYDAAVAGHTGDADERNPSYEWLASNLFFNIKSPVSIRQECGKVYVETFDQWVRHVIKKYEIPDSMSVDDAIGLCGNALHKAYDAGLPDAQRRLKEEKAWRLRVKELRDDMNKDKTEEA